MSDAPTSPRFSAATSTRLLDHAQLEALCADYDGFLLDLWGVVMDGTEAFPGALAWLARRHAEGRPVWFLSNSSSSVVEMSAGLERLGIRRDWFAGITTSGQLTIDALLQTAEYRRGGIYLAGVGLAQQSWPAEIRERFVEDIAQAALIVGVGSFPQDELEQRFAPLRGATDLPFLCANPDRVVVSGGRTVYGAGMLAELFSEEGGQVSWYGKPDPAAFRIAQRQLEARGARHILFVGDSLVTDVPGALAARIDTLWLGAPASTAKPWAPSSTEHSTRSGSGRCCTAIRSDRTLPRQGWSDPQRSEKGCTHALAGLPAMARHAGHGGGRLAGGVGASAKTQGRLLGVPRQQPAVDRLGPVRPGLCADPAAGLPGGDEPARHPSQRSATGQRLMAANENARHDGGRSLCEGCAQCAPSLFSSGWPA